ncbi:hypothetical protein ABT332_13595 [Saccharomonospora azurea]|uniref:hypothetical protein n=1 Tax=Saccharomonospora azurea TaxID=40988 RepID=UPI00331C9DA0
MRTQTTRGPMGGDDYTAVHDLVHLDSRISLRAKGMFGVLAAACHRHEALTPDDLQQHTREGRDAIRTACEELEQYHYLVVDPTTKQLYVTDLPARLRGVGLADDRVIAQRVRREFARWAASQPTSDAQTSLPLPVDAPAPTPKKRARNDLNENRADVDELCTLLATLMVEVNGCRPQTITKSWRDAARLLLDVDKCPFDEAKRLIEWCQKHHYWPKRVQSMTKFRAAYDEIRLDYQSAQRPPSAATGRSKPFTNPDNNDYDVAAFFGGENSNA